MYDVYAGTVPLQSRWLGPSVTARKGQRREGALVVPAQVAVLQALSAGPCWADGIRQKVEEATGMRLSRGNVTAAIQSLLLPQGEEFVEPAGQQPRADLGGMPRKLYRLTAAGAAEAERQRKVMMAVIEMGGGGPMAGPLGSAGTRAEGGHASEQTDPAPRERIVVLDDPEPEGDR